jgi:transposase
MSLQSSSIPPVPEETVRVARAAFRKGNVYLRLRDELGALYEDSDFAQLFPAVGPPGLPPWRLALITVMQFLENLSDRQAASARPTGPATWSISAKPAIPTRCT